MKPELHRGVVADANDPENLGRIVANVPGYLDQGTGWLLPILPAAGASGGLYAVPQRGDEVLVLVLDEEPDEGYYFGANWGRGEVPPEASSSTTRLLVSRDYAVVLDGHAGGRCSVVHRASGDGIVHDSATRALTITGTSRISISSVGAVDITAAAVTIQGRPVAPGTKPI